MIGGKRTATEKGRLFPPRSKRNSFFFKETKKPGGKGTEGRINKNKGVLMPKKMERGRA